MIQLELKFLSANKTSPSVYWKNLQKKIDYYNLCINQTVHFTHIIFAFLTSDI